MRSNKPESLAFQDWLAREVIPSLVKTGGHVVGQEAVGNLQRISRAERSNRLPRLRFSDLRSN